MQVKTLSLLESRFRPEDAKAIAEAIETEMTPARSVTNESMKIQLGELESKLMGRMSQLEMRVCGMEAHLSSKFTALVMGTAGLVVTIVLCMLLNLKK